MPLGKYFGRGPMLRIEIRGVFFARSGSYIISFSIICRPVFKMAATNAHHRCGAVNLRSTQSRFYLYLCSIVFYIFSGGYSNTSVVHMRDQRNAKTDSILRLNAIPERGQNVPILKKRGPFFLLYRGRLGVIFQTPLFHQTCFQKKSCLGSKIGCKITRNSCLGVLNIYLNLWSRICTTLVFQWNLENF